MSIITSTEQDNVQIIQWDDGKANAVSAPLLQELNQALDQAERDKRVVLLVGRPGRFSAGFDLQVMGQGGTAMAELVVGGARLALRLMQFPTPVVMVCSGHSLAMGGLLLQVGEASIDVEEVAPFIKFKLAQVGYITFLPCDTEMRVPSFKLK